MSVNTDALAATIGRLTQADGAHETAIPGLRLFRSSSVTEPLPCLYAFGLAVIVQGRKQVALGDDIIHYGAGQTLLMTADLPVVAHITHASEIHPYLGLMLPIDQTAILQTAVELDLPAQARENSCRAIAVAQLDDGVHAALVRLLALVDQPALAAHLAPLIQKEIIVRLLLGAHGPKLRQLVSVDSPSRKVGQAISWLKQNYNSTIRGDELAAIATMSPSSFRQHFRAVAGMSPLQYQKQLRLQEARQLMLNKKLDAGTAATRVGYESATQFSREYSRLFGLPPQRDIRRMQQAF